MTPRPPIAIAAALVAASAAAGVWGYLVLPAGATIALQLGLDGRMHQHLPKAEGLAILPAVAAIVVGSLAWGASRPRHQDALQAAGRPLGAIMTGVAGLLLVAQATLIQAARDADFQLMPPVAIACGVFLMMLGDSLGKARHNIFIGVRTRATLDDPRVWDKTHRLTARLMFVGGVLLSLAGFTLHDPLALAAAIALCAGGPPLIGAARSLILGRQAKS